MVTGKLVNNAWHHADGCMHVLVAICIVTRPAVTPLANIMTTIPVYQLEKVDRGLDKDAAAVRDQKLSETGFSYPADVPSSETNYTFYAIKESDRKPVLIGTGDIVVSRDGTFFYIAVRKLCEHCRACSASCSKHR